MSSETTLVLVVVFGTVAICSALAVLKAWLLQRRLPRVAGGWVVACAAVVMFSLIAAVPDSGGGGPAPEYRTPRYGAAEYIAAEQVRVDEMHRQIAPALELYRQTHGTYPNTLEDAGIQTPMTRYGPLHYYGSRSEESAWYLISFGDIERHRFSADWDSRLGEWSIVELD